MVERLMRGNLWLTRPETPQDAIELVAADVAGSQRP